MKPYSLYLMLLFAVILDATSFVLIVTGNGLGFIVSILGFMNTFIFVSIYVVSLLFYLGTKENSLQNSEKKEKNSLVRREMKKMRGKLFEKIRNSVFVAKIEKMVIGAIAAIVSLIPVIGSFIPAHTIAAVQAIRRANKIVSMIDKTGDDMKKIKQKAQRKSMLAQGVAMSTAPAQKLY